MFNPVLGTVEEQMGTADTRCCTLLWLLAAGCSAFGCRSVSFECLDHFSETSGLWLKTTQLVRLTAWDQWTPVFGERCQRHTVIFNSFPLTTFMSLFFSSEMAGKQDCLTQEPGFNLCLMVLFNYRVRVRVRVCMRMRGKCKHGIFTPSSCFVELHQSVIYLMTIDRLNFISRERGKLGVN